MYLGFHPAAAQAQRLHLGWFIKKYQLCSPALRTTNTEWPYVKSLPKTKVIVNKFPSPISYPGIF